VGFFDGSPSGGSTSGTAARSGCATAAPGRPSSCCTAYLRPHTTWHRVAPLPAAAGHTAVCPDLRGYGRSSMAPTTDDHAPYSKRAMARDVVALMRALGHERFAVVGHDRGSYVACGRSCTGTPG
jgi:haloacetate dehalogenase